MIEPEKAPHPVIRTIKPYVKESRVDGWLCIKYIDCGEESMSTFADVSKGDIIMYGNATRSRPYTRAEKVLDELIGWIRETKNMALDNLNGDYGTRGDRHVELILSQVLCKYEELRQECEQG